MKEALPQGFSFFLDEAGNTGDDLMGSDQHYFTLGGIGIPTNQEKPLQNFISNLKKDKRLEFELKGKSLLGTKNEFIIPTIVEEALRLNCLPFFTVLEKRFMVAAKIVENFFDPAYNSNTDNSWTFPSPRKISLANHFYDHLTLPTLKLVAIAMQKGYLNEIHEAYKLIQNEIQEPKIKATLAGAESHLSKLSHDLLQLNNGNFENLKGGALNSPNYTLYYEVINRIEDMMRNRNTDATLTFDSSREYNSAFTNLFNRHQNGKSVSLQFPGSTPLHFRFERLKAFDFQNSTQNSLIQVADLLCSSINSFFRKLEPSDKLWHLTKNDELWIGFIYVLVEMGLGDWVISGAMKKKYGSFIAEFNRNNKT